MFRSCPASSQQRELWCPQRPTQHHRILPVEWWRPCRSGQSYQSWHHQSPGDRTRTGQRARWSKVDLGNNLVKVDSEHSFGSQIAKINRSMKHRSCTFIYHFRYHGTGEVLEICLFIEKIKSAVHSASTITSETKPWIFCQSQNQRFEKAATWKLKLRNSEVAEE